MPCALYRITQKLETICVGLGTGKENPTHLIIAFNITQHVATIKQTFV